MLLVTLGSGPTTNYVQTPDGTKHNLGSISVLRFVHKLVSPGDRRRALDAFVEHGEALVAVDHEAMWDFLRPVRARWATKSSFGAVNFKLTPKRSRQMTKFAHDLNALESHITALNAASKKATNLSEGVETLVRLASKIKSPHQSENAAYYGLGAPKVETAETFDKLSIDVYNANEKIASAIATTAEETLLCIDRLASEGRKFNASKARADVKGVLDKVAEVLSVDLTAPWVVADLTKLAARADALRALFP